MRNYIRTAVFSFVLYVGLTGSATATSLGLITTDPTIEASLAFIDYLEFGGDGDLSTFGAEVDFVDGVSPVGITEISFGIGYSLANPTDDANGGFDIFDQNGLFLIGNLFRIGFLEDIIELQFNNLAGSAAGDFGSSVLALVTFDNPLGPNPFVSLVDGNSYTASISISRVAATIPLPASLPLMLIGLGALGFMLRRHRTD